MNNNNLQKRSVKFLGSGKYLPKKVMTGEELDRKLWLDPGTTERISGVRQRHYAGEEETNSKMAAYAIMAALENAHLRYDNLDAIINASGTTEQSIPCTGALIQKALGKPDSGTPCFDVNSTCLSFVTGLDVASSLLSVGRFKTIAIVSSEVASVGLNWKETEACSLFGDGAVAFIIQRPEPNETSSTLFGAHMETYSSGSEYCSLKGGGTKLHPRKIKYDESIEDQFLFHMEGRKVFKTAFEKIDSFISNLLAGTNVKLQDFKLIVPHQASASGMALMKRRLGIAEDRWLDILADHGNMIAASIPLGLHYSIQDKRIERGDKVMLVGTSAGLSIGGLAFEY